MKQGFRGESGRRAKGWGGRGKEKNGGGRGGAGIAKRELEMRGGGRRWSFDRAVLWNQRPHCHRNYLHSETTYSGYRAHVELTLFVCRLRVACNEATIYSVYARPFAHRHSSEEERGGGRERKRDIAYPVLRARRRFRASRNRSRERELEGKREKAGEREREREREVRRTLHGARTRRRSGKGARAARQESESRLMSRCSIYLLNYICMCMLGNYGGYCAREYLGPLYAPADLPIVIATTSFDHTGVAKEMCSRFISIIDK